MTVEKEKFVKDLKRFVTSGFKESLFTKPLYQRLSFCFGHIAHYDKVVFYDVWFSSPENRIRWLLRIQNAPLYGDPKFCYVDAERDIQAWLRDNPEYMEHAQAAVLPSREQRLEDALRRITELNSLKLAHEPLYRYLLQQLRASKLSPN